MFVVSNVFSGVGSVSKFHLYFQLLASASRAPKTCQEATTALCLPAWWELKAPPSGMASHPVSPWSDSAKLFSLAPFGTASRLYRFGQGAAKGAVQTLDFPVPRPAKSSPDPLAFKCLLLCFPFFFLRPSSDQKPACQCCGIHFKPQRWTILLCVKVVRFPCLQVARPEH